MPNPRRPGGPVKPASPERGRSEAERLDEPEGRPTISQRDGPAWCHARTPSVDPRGERSRLAEAEVAAGVADDQVIEQRQVEDIGRLRQPDRQLRIVGAGCGVTARVVVHHEQCGGAGCETRGYEHVRKRDGRARARAAREQMPGEETMLGGEARDGKDLHRFVGQQWRQRHGSGPWVAEGQCGQADGVALVIAQRAVRADELADAMSAGKAVVWSR